MHYRGHCRRACKISQTQEKQLKHTRVTGSVLVGHTCTLPIRSMQCKYDIQAKLGGYTIFYASKINNKSRHRTGDQCGLSIAEMQVWQPVTLAGGVYKTLLRVLETD